MVLPASNFETTTTTVIAQFMPTTKKADEGNGFKNPRAGAAQTGGHATVPRTWLAVVTVFVVVPWVIVAALYFRDLKPAPEAATPAAPSQPAVSGPWGQLTTTPIVVSPPLEYVSLDWGRHSDGADEWHFPGVSAEEVERFLATAGLPREQVAPLVSRARPDPSHGGVILTPDPELVRSLTPEVRARLYTLLAKTPLNGNQANSFRFFGSSTDSWLGGSLMSPETRRILEPLIYRQGEVLHFADVELFRSQVTDALERQRAAKTLLRESTMLVRLTVRDVSEVAALVEYWGRGGRRTDVRPILESIAGAGSDRSIDIVHLLPALMRNHLYRYPKISAGDLDKPLLANCLWTSLNVFRAQPDDRLLDVNTALETLKRDYFIVEAEHQLGDVVAFLDERGVVFHAAVYIADDLLFSKNGTSPVAPWIITRTDRLKAHYRGRSESPRLIYHRRNDL